MTNLFVTSALVVKPDGETHLLSGCQTADTANEAHAAFMIDVKPLTDAGCQVHAKTDQVPQRLIREAYEGK